MEEGEEWREGGRERIIYKREDTYKRVLCIELSMREQTIFFANRSYSLLMSCTHLVTLSTQNLWSQV